MYLISGLVHSRDRLYQYSRGGWSCDWCQHKRLWVSACFK